MPKGYRSQVLEGPLSHEPTAAPEYRNRVLNPPLSHEPSAGPPLPTRRDREKDEYFHPHEPRMHGAGEAKRWPKSDRLPPKYR